jgi:hypothetical protein
MIAYDIVVFKDILYDLKNPYSAKYKREQWQNLDF